MRIEEMTLPADSAQFVNNPDFFAAMIFLSPRSPQWPLVWGLCQSADAIAEGKGYYAAAFYCKERSIETLTSICHITQEWKTAHLFVKRKKIAHIFSIKWIHCFLQSFQCDNPAAWCLDITKAPRRLNDFTELDHTFTINMSPDALAERRPERVAVRELFVCPCKQLAPLPWGKIELPVDLKDQFQAFAVERGLNSCPHFDMTQFKPLHETVTI